MDAPFIPPKTLQELAASHPEGTRHEAMIKVAMSLLGNGFPDSAVFSTLRSKFDADKTDKEIRDVISWCLAKNPTPSIPINGHSKLSYQKTPEKPKLTKEESEKEALNLAMDFIDGVKSTEEATISRSKVPIGEIKGQASLLLKSLYSASDKLNLVCRYTVNEKGKANPSGAGKTLPRDEWVAFFEKEGVPHSEAGAWMRPNPVNDGTGKDGAITDADISRMEFSLLESDHLPVGVQLALYEKWNLPIAALLTSGGGSVHAWVRVGASNRAEYDSLVVKLLELVKPFGFDQSNKNPSRLSRLVGVKRSIGSEGDGIQKLLYLNPECKPLTQHGLDEFQKQVTPPFLSSLPMKKVARESLDRYEELHANKGATGLQTGLTTFDRKTGGLKRGSMIVVAAQTNTGKTSLVLNIISRALKDGKTVALFTLEMGSDEIYDLLVSMNFSVDRNVFNTGNFSEKDMVKIASASSQISKWPLYLFDDPDLSCEQIEERCLKIPKLDLVVVDYLQLVSTNLLQKDNREQQVAQIGRSLRKLAKKCKAPLIAVSQLNEEGKIRESRAVAHDAHIVFILEWVDGKLKLRITKGRGVKKEDYVMDFDAIFCRMTEASRISDEEIERRGYND